MTDPQANPLILVADDDMLNRELLQANLEIDGYDVLEAGNGEKALELAFLHLPDLILLDVQMPGINGYEVCRQLKADPKTQNIPILIVTGLDGDDDRRTAIEAGAEDFLLKPLNALIMKNRIRTLLRLRRLHQAVAERDDLLGQALEESLSHQLAESIRKTLKQQSTSG